MPWYDCLFEISLNDKLSVTHRNITLQLTLMAKWFHRHVLCILATLPRKPQKHHGRISCALHINFNPCACVFWHEICLYQISPPEIFHWSDTIHWLDTKRKWLSYGIWHMCLMKTRTIAGMSAVVLKNKDKRLGKLLSFSSLHKSVT